MTTTRLNWKRDTQRGQKKLRATSHNSKNCGIVERCLIDRTLLI